jgi:hypothetical protein
MARWAWGNLHRVEFNHTLGAQKPLDKIWLFGNCRDRQPVMHLFCGKIAWRMTAYVKNHGNSQ